MKFAAYEDTPSLPWVLEGGLTGLHDAPRLTIAFAHGRNAVDSPAGQAPMDGRAALAHVLDVLRIGSLAERVEVIGHRIVHGGEVFTDPTRLDSSTLGALQDLVPLAPLHQPFNLSLVAAAVEMFPHALQIGCFDTAFHIEQPKLARLYGLPRGLSESGVLAYGFHGLSYTYIAAALRRRYGPQAGGRVIVAHLGSGVSLCGLLEGRSVATTMGFSVLDGPPMSTRCGSIDPGVVLYLIQERGMSPEAVSKLLHEQSGWLGMSGVSGDMSTLLGSESPGARDAIDLFVYRVGREIGSLAAALEGLDRLVFTAGVGEHAPAIRERICKRAGWLGVHLDPARNARGEEVVSADDSAIDVLVIPTDEERVIAEGCRTWREFAASEFQS